MLCGISSWGNSGQLRRGSRNLGEYHSEAAGQACLLDWGWLEKVRKAEESPAVSKKGNRKGKAVDLSVQAESPPDDEDNPLVASH